MSGPGALEKLGRRMFVALGFRSEHVQTSVGPMHIWRVQGRGSLPPVVLFHGFASSGMHWIPLMQKLRTRVSELLALDLPAHGFSHRPEALTREILKQGALEALDQIHRAPAVLVGNSMGGAAAFRYVHARPERVLGALLFSPAGAPMDEAQLASLRAIFAIDAHTEAVDFVRKLHARPPGIKAHAMAPLLRRSLSDPLLRRWLHEVSPEDFLTPEEVASVPRPVRIVWGQQERILPLEAREFWRAHLPAHSELIEPEGFGHSPFLDDRAWVVSEILQFGERLSTS